MRQAHVSAEQLQTIPITWPFSTWGLDIVSTFKTGMGEVTHLLVAINKFTKWIEAKPMTSITAAKVVEFIRELVNYFRVPSRIITNNGTQFTHKNSKVSITIWKSRFTSRLLLTLRAVAK